MAAARWAPAGEVLDGPAHLAFDHRDILRDGVERARAKLEYTPLATTLSPPLMRGGQGASGTGQPSSSR